MEWNSKLPAWGLSDLDESGELGSAAMDIRDGLMVGASGSGVVDCSVDLKLGALEQGIRPPGKYLASQPMAAPPRRGRAGGSSAACLVDGCRSDLSNSREYHRRHKVCEAHSKTPVVLISGQEQRFCQQCSRFHQLMEFDDVKRSCRKRLDGHNRRRRKLQPESTTSSASTGLFPIQGSRGFIHSDPTSATPTYTNPLPRKQASGSFCTNTKLKQFPFLQQQEGYGAAIGFSRAATMLPAGRESSSRQDFELDCALSLLSSAPNPSAAMGQMLPAGRIPEHRQHLSHLPGLPYSSVDLSTAGFSCLGIDVEQVVDTAFNSEEAADAGLHCQNMFNVIGEGSSPQALLPFSWQ